MPHPIAAVVLLHNSVTKVFSLLRILRATLDSDSRIICVDNGSTDGVDRYLAAFAGIVTKRLDQPLSPGAALNLALAEIPPKFTVIKLDDDVIPLPGCLHGLAHLANAAGVGVVGARLLTLDGHIQHAGGVGLRPRAAAEQNWCVQSCTDERPTRVVDWVSGACCLITPAARQRVPCFEEAYPLWFDDIDYCFAVRREGLAVVASAEAKAYHMSDGKSDGRPQVFLSHRLFRSKWQQVAEVWSQ